jgi:hypothetical protein
MGENAIRSYILKEEQRVTADFTAQRDVYGLDTPRFRLADGYSQLPQGNQPEINSRSEYQLVFPKIKTFYLNFLSLQKQLCTLDT